MPRQLLSTTLVVACATSSGERTRETSGESSASSESSKDSESDSQSETDEVPGKYAVFPRSATFSSSPSSDDDQTWSSDHEGYFTFRTTDWGDQWVELQPSEDSDAVYWFAPSILSDLELVVYAEREDVSPVLAEGFEREYGDGTSAKLSAGLPVDRNSDERWRAKSPYFEVPIDKKDVSISEGFDSVASNEIEDPQVFRANKGVEIGGNVLPGSKGAAFRTEGAPAEGTEATHRIVTNCLESHAHLRGAEHLGTGLFYAYTWRFLVGFRTEFGAFRRLCRKRRYTKKMRTRRTGSTGFRSGDGENRRYRGFGGRSQPRKFGYATSEVTEGTPR